MTKSSIALIIAGALILTGIALIVIGGTCPYKPFNYLEASPVNVEIVEDFDEVRIETTSDDVEIRVSEDGKARIESQENDERRLIIHRQSGTLFIERENSESWISFWRADRMDGKITVFLPQKVYDKLDIVVTSGDIYAADGLKFGSVSLYTTSGDIDVRGITADDIVSHTTSGATEFCDIMAGKIKISATSGNTKLSEVACESLKMHSTSGEHELSDVSVVAAAEIETTSGDIEFERLSAAYINIDGTSTDIDGSIVGPMVYSVKTTSGDVEIPFSAEGGECRLKTTSGDITITEIKE